jgi:hypothetical protein
VHPCPSVVKMNPFIVSAYQGCEVRIARAVSRALLQPRPALLADPPVDIRAKVFPAGGAHPVYGSKDHVRSNDNNLGPKERTFRKFSEDIRSLIDDRAQENRKERYCYRDDLAALALPELLHDLFRIFFLRHRNSLLTHVLYTNQAGPGLFFDGITG